MCHNRDRSKSRWGLNAKASYVASEQHTMAGSEAAPLILKRASVPNVTEDKVGCCCVESSRLAKVPVISTLCRKRRPEEKVHDNLAVLYPSVCTAATIMRAAAGFSV